MDFVTIVGLMAASCTTISFIPQVLHILKTRDTKSISLGMYIIFTFGVTCWLIYGICHYDLPIIIANSTTLILAVMILIFKLKYK